MTSNADGTITHNIAKSKDGKPRVFKDETTYKRWLGKHIMERKAALQLKLTPNQFYLTQGMGTERPFNGAYWWNKDVGMYACVVC